MMAKKIFVINSAKSIRLLKIGFLLSCIITASIVIITFSTFPVFAGAEKDYTPTSYKCISCHNDTGYPVDTDGDGVAAPYKRPHNNNTMCEDCHKADPHTIKFIQPDGTYAGKLTAASCPDCHQTGIPFEVNSNFTNAFKIPKTLSHSSDPSNGSVWGSYWTTPRTACIYCHNSTLHDIMPLGRILKWNPAYKINSSIGTNYSCSGCHYKGDPNWTVMNAAFAAAGLQTPPEITNGTNWNGIYNKYYNHSINGYTDNFCKGCHGLSLDPDAPMSEFLHNVSIGDMRACVSCHTDKTIEDLGLHASMSGTAAVENSDCTTCHFGGANISMVKGGANKNNTYFCADCHTAAGNGSKKSSIIFTDQKHGKASCMDCHVADGIYHQGNPRGSVANSTYVNRYVPGNTTVTDCADCHYATNLDDAPFNAPGGGQHIASFGPACANGGTCHTVPPGNNMIQTIHRVGAQNQSLKPTISIPSLNGSTVLQGTDVSVTATVNFTGIYAFIDGAQYRIMSGQTEIRSWIPMSAVDGNFNSTSEVAIGTIDTNSLTSGTYSIEVRGMAGGPAHNTAIRYYPINCDVSITQNTTLTIESSPEGYINVTVTSGGVPLPEANVWINWNDIKKTDANGNYSFNVPEGTYNVTASKQPTHNDNTVSGITPSNTTIVEIDLVQKSIGTIGGKVTNA